MGIQANQFVIGTAGNDTFNFLLDTDIAGALRFRRKSDGSGGAVLTVRADGTLLLPAKSCIRLNTANGSGTTNTAIRRFLNLTLNQGTDITYADSAAFGATFTINTSDLYSISYCDAFSTQSRIGLSLNSTQLTTAISGINVGDRLQSAFTPAANNEGVCSWTGYLLAGSVVRPHSDGGANAASLPLTQFTIARVG